MSRFFRKWKWRDVLNRTFVLSEVQVLPDLEGVRWIQNPPVTPGSACLPPTRRIFFLGVFADEIKPSGSGCIDASRLIFQSAVSFQIRLVAKKQAGRGVNKRNRGYPADFEFIEGPIRFGFGLGFGFGYGYGFGLGFGLDLDLNVDLDLELTIRDTQMTLMRICCSNGSTPPHHW